MLFVASTHSLLSAYPNVSAEALRRRRAHFLEQLVNRAM